MRITAGRLKGRVFGDMHSSKAHPMSDRIRNALFNSLGDLAGLNVLDAFGGSGALAFEALSRGAHHAVICESNRKVLELIENNIKKLELTRQTTLIRKNVYTYLKETSEKFDVLLLDPPFDEFHQQNLEAFNEVARPGAVMLLSLPSSALTPLNIKWDLLKYNKYGNASLAFYEVKRA